MDTNLEQGNERKRGNTKEQFLNEGLRLFAQSGYDSVSLAQIADRVGLSTPALYRHFSSKEALFQAIIDMSNDRYTKNMMKLSYPYLDYADRLDEVVPMTVEEEIQAMQEALRFMIHSEYPRLFRRLIGIEQYRRPELATIYKERYMSFPIQSYEIYMRAMIHQGRLKSGDTVAMAMHYAMPNAMLMEMCDRDPSMETQAMEMLERHIREFHRVYDVG